jgi:hypothetical protein
MEVILSNSRKDSRQCKQVSVRLTSESGAGLTDCSAGRGGASGKGRGKIRLFSSDTNARRVFTVIFERFRRQTNDKIRDIITC